VCTVMVNNCPIMSQTFTIKLVSLDAVFHSASNEHIFYSGIPVFWDFRDTVCDIANLSILLDRTRRVRLETRIERLEQASGRIVAGIIRIGC